MRIMQMPRGAGKTYSLVTIAAERQAHIVCKDRREAHRISEMAQDRELDIPFPITFSEFANKQYYGAGIKEMLIDDVDALINYFSPGIKISYCTYTPT